MQQLLGSEGSVLCKKDSMLCTCGVALFDTDSVQNIIVPKVQEQKLLCLGAIPIKDMTLRCIIVVNSFNSVNNEMMVWTLPANGLPKHYTILKRPPALWANEDDLRNLRHATKKKQADVEELDGQDER